MVSAIVLAAGESRRMGQDKLLVPYGRSTVLQHVIEALQSSDLDEVVVVVSKGAKDVAKLVKATRAKLVLNPDSSRGMLSSVRCGLEGVSPQTDAVMVVLGDQPSLSADIVDQLIYTYQGTESSIVVPKCRGRRGHPLLFSMKFKSDVMEHYDEVGLRGLLNAHSEHVFELPIRSDSILNDLDTLDDYQRELDRLQ